MNVNAHNIPQKTHSVSSIAAPPPPMPLNGLRFPKINLKQIVAFYEALVERAILNVDKGQMPEALATIAEAAKIAYLVNWRYCDDRLEDALGRISDKNIVREDFTPKDNERILFFDSWGLDSRGLSLQYVRALKAFGAPLLYICDNRNEAASVNLRAELLREPAAEVVYLDEITGSDEKIKKIYESAVAFAPTRIMMHMTPWAVEAITAFRAMPDVVKYQINLTDHAFWLGTGCSDYLLEFRKYGRTISATQRGILASQIILSPYYPIVEDNMKGQLPERRPGDTVILTGGAYYKMYGRDGYFFDMITNLLEDNANVTVWIAGNGRATFLEKRLQPYIKTGRIQMIGNRKDINAVIKASDIYLSTYPFCGGLMAQLAAVHEKPILSFTTMDLVTNRLEDIIGTAKTPKTTTTDIDTFKRETSELINDSEARLSRAKATKASMHNRADFESRVLDIITQPKKLHDADPKPLEIDQHAITSLYLEIENNFQDQLARHILHNASLRSTARFPMLTAKAATQVGYFMVLNLFEIIKTQILRFPSAAPRRRLK